MTKLRLLALALPLAFAAGAAHADQAAADQCAAGLSGDAKTIYEATAPNVTPGSNLRNVVTEQTKSLAMAGTISRGDARQSAQAAAACLELLQN